MSSRNSSYSKPGTSKWMTHDAISIRITGFKKGVFRKSLPRFAASTRSTVGVEDDTETYRRKPNYIADQETIGATEDRLFILSPTSNLYDNFLNFATIENKTKAVREDYRNFKRSGFNLPLTMIVVFLNCGYFATRGSLHNLWFLSKLNVAFLCAFLCGILSFLLIIMALFNRISILSYAYGITCLQSYHKAAVKRMRSSRSQFIEDFIIILVATAQSLYLFGRIRQGECNGGSLFDSQECNPQASSHALPQDQLGYVFIGVLFVQVFLKGTSKVAIMLAWCVNVIFVNVCLYLVGSDQYYWINTALALCISISYEIERTTLCLYLERKMSLNAKARRDATEKVVGKMTNQRDIVNKVNIELQGTIVNSAHDMKSPCTALSLAIESLLRTMTVLQDDSPNPVNSENLHLVRGMALTLSCMGMTINRSMDFAKSACGIELVPSLGSLDALCSIRQAVEYVSWEDSTSGDTIEVEHGSCYQNEIGVTDPTWFAESVFCLITNAVKYSKQPGGIKVEIKQTHNDLEDTANFSVQDSGTSLSPAILDTLFDPPIQGRRGQEGGMGLGLVCLAERVKALGGSYGACLRTDHKSGTVIWFRIPFPPIDKAEGIVSRHSMSPSHSNNCLPALMKECPSVAGLRILVVDDAVTILKMMAFILTKAGAGVTQVKNGREAVEKTKETRFDVIITDIQMPVLDGYSAAREIRELERFHSIQPKIIIGISASSDAGRCEEALAAGMDAFLIKPFRLIDLINVIKERSKSLTRAVQNSRRTSVQYDEKVDDFVQPKGIMNMRTNIGNGLIPADTRKISNTFGNFGFPIAVRRKYSP